MVMGEEEASADAVVGSDRAALIVRVVEGLVAVESNRYKEQAIFDDGCSRRHSIVSAVYNSKTPQMKPNEALDGAMFTFFLLHNLTLIYLERSSKRIDDFDSSVKVEEQSKIMDRVQPKVYVSETSPLSVKTLVLQLSTALPVARTDSLRLIQPREVGKGWAFSLILVF